LWGPRWYPGGRAPVEPRRHGLKQTQARRWREPRTPDMADHDLGVREQWGKLRRIGLVIEDLRLQGHFGLGEDARSDGRREMPEKSRPHCGGSLVRVVERYFPRLWRHRQRLLGS